MSATETEEVNKASVDAGDEAVAEPDAASSEPTGDSDATAGSQAMPEASETEEPLENADVTMSPPGRVEELFDLANQSIERLDEASLAVKALAASQQEAVEQAGDLAPSLKKAMEEAASEALESGGAVLAKRVEEAAGETTKALESSIASSQQAVEQMEAATSSFKLQMWRNSLFASLAAASIGLIAVLLAGWVMTWWVREDVDALREEHRELTSEIRTLKETADDWATRFGRADVSTCKVPGESERPCVRVDVDAGVFRGDNGEHYRVLWGY